MQLGRLLFRFRNPLAALPIGYALFSTRWEWENAVPAWSIAVGLASAGVALRAWATCHCKYSSGQKKMLACTGPYALIRNPLYVGNILIILGAIVASELIWLLPLAALWALGVYSAVAAYEDRIMVAKFGEDYLRYRAAVPAWVPSFRSWSPGKDLTDRPPFFDAVVRQAANFVWLVPFVIKDLRLFGLGDPT